MALDMSIAELVADKKSTKAVKAREALSISKLKAAIPSTAFEKNLAWSLWYMMFDYAFIAISMLGMHYLIASGVYEELPLLARLAVTAIHWNVAGFFMWGIFVVGHDCGHGTFSNYEWLNDILGHVTHGSILVPYWPWRLSHQRHHMKHNHVHDDYSHPWITPEEMNLPEHSTNKWWSENFPTVRAALPIFGWPFYIAAGLPDGNHFIPFSGDRLWKDAPQKEIFQCIVSSLWVLGNMAAQYWLFEGDMMALFHLYYAPILVFGWWLTTVTYLQHHGPDSVVYGDSNWSYVMAAFETIDRKFGFGIDHLHHHITDGHVAHHLFFRNIPHYNLPIATKALTEYLEANGISSIYKFEETYDFPLRVHSDMAKYGFMVSELKDGKELNDTVRLQPKKPKIN